MTISPYQINSILKAYSKQSKIKTQAAGSEPAKKDMYIDVVSLSADSESEKANAFNKISYSLLDIIVKGKE